MRLSVPPLDLRPLPLCEQAGELSRRLASLAQDEALLVQSRRDLRSLVAPGWEILALVDGPSLWLVALHRPGDYPELLTNVRRQHRSLEQLYRQAFSEAFQGRPQALELGRRMEALLTRHLDLEESLLYPLYLRLTGDPRTPREMGYEHEGVRRGLGRLAEMLGQAAAGQASKRQIDAYEIDFFHLLEHHTKREEGALLPLIERLDPAEAERIDAAFGPP